MLLRAAAAAAAATSLLVPQGAAAAAATRLPVNPAPTTFTAAATATAITVALLVSSRPSQKQRWTSRFLRLLARARQPCRRDYRRVKPRRKFPARRTCESLWVCCGFQVAGFWLSVDFRMWIFLKNICTNNQISEHGTEYTRTIIANG